MKDTPKIVSGRVVKTSMKSSEPLIPNFTKAPSDFPIQFLWLSFTASDQSSPSSPLKSLSE